MGSSFSRTAIVQGDVAEGYETVREMFVKNVETGRERDAQLCIYVEGEKVVDLWGSAEGDLSYTGDTLQCTFSSSKAVTAVAIAQLAQRGLLNYNVPVANYWAEFGQNLKSQLRIEDVLRHEGGMPHLDTSLHLDDLMTTSLSNGSVASVLARQTPIMPVDTPREYHGLTAGWVMNEVFRRLSPDQSTLGTWLRREVAQPLQIDVHMGLSDTELSRVKDVTGFTTNYALLQSLIPNVLGGQVDHNIMVFSKMLKSFKRRFMDDEFAKTRGYSSDLVEMMQDPSDPSSDFVTRTTGFFNSIKWRQSECPHGNVHASARGLAKLAAAMANGGSFQGVEILSKEGWDLLHRNPVVQVDATMSGCRTEFTQGGVNVFNDYQDDRMGERILKSGRHGFIGWMGFGGSVVQWHPGVKMGFGYTCTLLTWWDLANTKARKIQKEAVRCAVMQKQINSEKTAVDLNNNEATAEVTELTDTSAQPVLSVEGS